MVGSFAITAALVAGIISFIVGIAIILKPRLIAYILGAYLIVIGVIAIIVAVT